MRLFALCCLALLAVSLVSANKKLDSRLASTATPKKTAPAAPLEKGSSSGSCGCNPPSPCDNPCGDSSPSIISSINSHSDLVSQQISNMGPRPRVDDAIRPVDEWINDFKKRTQLHGSLWDAARTTVMPLLRKLEKTQKDAIDRLIESNKAIREHVEDAAVQHIYNLLRSKRALQEVSTNLERQKAQVEAAKEAASDAEMQKKDVEATEKSLEKALKSEEEDVKAKGDSKDVVDKIDKVLTEKSKDKVKKADGEANKAKEEEADAEEKKADKEEKAAKDKKKKAKKSS